MNLVVSGMLNKQIARKNASKPGDEKDVAKSLPELVRMADKFKSIT